MTEVFQSSQMLNKVKVPSFNNLTVQMLEQALQGAQAFSSLLLNTNIGAPAWQCRVNLRKVQQFQS